ncbi:GDSL-type esterase/lipase family protein [Nibricoccus sp. IMCC34717]|uniref:GDSL-type esterase/lipase family protein n=1 Tax=Nibricoccus sp. IMCC34717 TaxID=3034021 RepID=UPI00384AED42
MALLSPVGAAGAFVPAAESPAVCEGRFATGAAGEFRLGFPGQQVHLRAEAASLAVKLRGGSDTAFFDFIVDGGAPKRVRLAKGEAEYPIFNYDRPGLHTVVLVRRNESWQGTADVLGFATDGRLLAPAALPERRLLFIGDSVTCGAVSETTYDSPKQPGWGAVAGHADTCNARAGFGGLLASRFGAQAHFVSYGGRGVVRDWQGLKTIANAPQFYELALPDDATVAWDHARYVPDAIVIALGTNDFNQGIPDQNDWVNAYVEFVRKVRRDAPKAHVFLSQSPIVKDTAGEAPRRSVLNGYLSEVVRRLGDDHVHEAPVAHYPGLPGDGHPVGSEHAQIAEELAQVMVRELGWGR